VLRRDAAPVVGKGSLSLLEGHPTFVLAEVAASGLGGKSYAEATRWILPRRHSEGARDLAVTAVDADFASPVLLSGLDAAVADTIEPLQADAESSSCRTRSRSGCGRTSRSSSRGERRPSSRSSTPAVAGGGRRIVTNPNCSVRGSRAMAWRRSTGLRHRGVAVTTLQALSGPAIRASRRSTRTRTSSRSSTRRGEDRARAEEDPRAPRGGARRGRRLPDLGLRQPRTVRDGHTESSS